EAQLERNTTTREAQLMHREMLLRRREQEVRELEMSRHQDQQQVPMHMGQDINTEHTGPTHMEMPQPPSVKRERPTLPL
ncbi:hypothetical protein KIPB_001152, partial [Kipferlia bialata]